MENSFAAVHPELVCEWSDKNAPLTPDDITYGSKKLYWWKGPCGHEWTASPKSRSAGEKCPICAGSRVVAGINDLKTLRPNIASEWSEKNILSPDEVTPGSHKKVLWKGSCGHEWTATVKSRIQGTGCPYCSHNIVLPGFNDLETLFPELAAEWSDRNLPLKPSMVTAYRNQKVWWRCSKGHEWKTLISTRSYGSRCPYCSGIQILSGYNDLATTHPELAQEWSERNDPLTPAEVNEKSRNNVWWKCSACGNEYKAVVHSRVHGLKCPVCTDRAVLQGYNDLATTDPEIAAEWDYSRNTGRCPSNISRHSSERAWWICPSGHAWNCKISGRTIEGKNCKECEKEYLTLLPQLAASYYAGRQGLTANLNSDTAIGVRMEAFIPEVRLAIDVWSASKENSIKEFLCRKNGIIYVIVPDGIAAKETEVLRKVIKAFGEAHIYISSDTEKDAAFIRERFFIWKRKHNH